jgi:hypothetical protein
MTDQSMFNETNNQQSQTTTITQSDPFVDKLMAIRNENGEPKYKDVPTALEALAASQQFIETLKSEKRAVEEQLAREKAERERIGNIEDFVKRLSPTAPPTNTSATPTNTQGLSEERVAQLLQEQLVLREQENMKQQNLNIVVGALSKVHGEQASQFISQKAKELNTTPAALKELAMSNPTMALSLLGAGSVKSNSTPSQSSLISPITQANDNPAPKFERGAARGGLSNKELKAMFETSKAYTNKRLGLES